MRLVSNRLRPRFYSLSTSSLPSSHRSLVYRSPPRIHPLIAYSPLRYMDNTDRATHRPAPMPSSLLPRGHHQHSNITAAEMINKPRRLKPHTQPRHPPRPRETRDTQKQGRTPQHPHENRTAEHAPNRSPRRTASPTHETSRTNRRRKKHRPAPSDDEATPKR